MRDPRSRARSTNSVYRRRAHPSVESERQHEASLLTRHLEGFAGGCQDAQGRSAGDQSGWTAAATAPTTCSQLSRTMTARHPDSASTSAWSTGAPGLRRHAQGGGDGVEHRARVREGGELDHPHSVGVLAGEGGAHLDRHPGLAHATHAGQGHEPVAADELDELGQHPLAADGTGPQASAGCPIGRTGARGREQRLRAFDRCLEQALGARQVGQAVITEVEAGRHRRSGPAARAPTST